MVINGEAKFKIFAGCWVFFQLRGEILYLCRSVYRRFSDVNRIDRGNVPLVADLAQSLTLNA